MTDSEKAIFQAIKYPKFFDIVLMKLKMYTLSPVGGTENGFQCLP